MLQIIQVRGLESSIVFKDQRQIGNFQFPNVGSPLKNRNVCMEMGSASFHVPFL